MVRLFPSASELAGSLVRSAAAKATSPRPASALVHAEENCSPLAGGAMFFKIGWGGNSEKQKTGILMYLATGVDITEFVSFLVYLVI